MPEAEPPRHVGGADDVQPEQLVERVERRRLGRARSRRGELGIERIAGHGRALEQAPRPVGQQRELLGQRRGHGRRHLHAAE